MFSVLANRSYRHLFAAQIIALIGTGLMTVALGLLAYQLAGADAGLVLGTALAIKMIAFVIIAPIAQALAHQIPRRSLMVSMDLVRASVALTLPFVTEVWQIYILIFVLQAASATFTPTFQAVIPDLLPDEADYTRALALSRMAYDFESLLSPLLAALLLTVVSFTNLFAGTVAGFLLSAALVLGTKLPVPPPVPARGIWERTTRGLRIYLATPSLRGLLALNLAIAAGGAMVIVNTVVFVKAYLGLGEAAVAGALASYGAGSMLSALVLTRLLERASDRAVMLTGAIILVLGTALGPMIASYGMLLCLWFALGFGYSMAQTPGGRLVRRSAAPEDRPSVFAAQFALSHACWLLCYPMAGWLGASQGLSVAFLSMSAIGATGLLTARRLWPKP